MTTLREAPAEPLAGLAARRVAWVTLAAAGAGLLVVGLVWVPWHPVPGGMPDPVAASSQFDAGQIARAEHFARWARVWSWGGLAVSLVAYVWLARSAVRGRVGDRLSRVGGPWGWQVLVAATLVEVVVTLVRLPFIAAQHVHLVRAGLSTQGWAGLAADLGKGLAVGVVTVGVAVTLVIGCARRWPRAWPAVAGSLLAGLVWVGSFAYPVLVEPLFNHFTSLPDGALRTQVLALADREGVPVDDVLVADASRRTTTLNAYVSGFGSTRRVVLYDTLVRDLPPDQVLSVVAHELAHAHHADVVIGSALGSFGALGAVGLAGLVWPTGSRRRWPELTRVASVPVLLAAVAVGTLAVSPIQNAVSRSLETRADVDALRATGERAPFVTMQRELAVHALSDPTPPHWSQWWFGSHPTVLQRIALADRMLGGS